MNSKIIWLSILAVILSFFGGFYLANSLNGGEIAKARAENEQLKKSLAENPPDDSSGNLTDDEISQKIAQADKNPTDFNYQRNLGLALYNYGAMKQNVNLIEQSSRLLNRVYENNPKDIDVTIALANGFYDIASTKSDNNLMLKSRTFYEKALNQKPDDATVRADYGSTFIFANPPEIEKGIAELQKSLEKEPKNQRGLQFMIQAMLKQNKPDEAEKFLAQLKEVNPQTPGIEDFKVRNSQENK